MVLGGEQQPGQIEGQALLDAEMLDVLLPFTFGQTTRGPDLTVPRPRLRIIPGKLAGAPHVVDTRIETQALAALGVAEAVGHDPIRATGLVLAHLGTICHDTRPDRPQVWTLRTVRKAPEDPWSFMTKAADQQQLAADVLYKRERLRSSALLKSPLS